MPSNFLTIESEVSVSENGPKPHVISHAGMALENLKWSVNLPKSKSTLAMNKKKYTRKYTLFGIAFGFAFPVMSLGLDLGVFHPQPFTWEGLVNIHLANPLHFIIDSAPLFLGLAFGIAGRYLDRASRVNVMLQSTNEQLQEKHEQIMQGSEEVMAQKELLEMQARELSRTNQRIKSSLVYARRIQQATLGTEGVLNPTLKQQMFIYLRPKDVVCGDFYWMYEDSRYQYLAAIDCTGHGVPSAFMTLIGNNLLNQIVEHLGITEPKEILEQLDQLLLRTLKNEGEMDEERMQLNDGMDVALCRIDHHEKVVTFAGAKRPMMLIQGGEQRLAKGGKYPIGSFQYRNKKFGQDALPYQVGDMLYIYTDGLSDQFGGPYDRKFMHGNFRGLLQDVAHLPLDEQKLTIDKRMRVWQGSHPQTDDMLLMGVQL